MKISVIITVYNRPEMVTACLRSLLLSTRQPDEVVVSDDGSSVGTMETMEEGFRSVPFSVKYVRQEDQGFRLAAARNNGIRHSTGDYIVSLDCDILLLPDALEAHILCARPGRFLAGNRALLNEQESSATVKNCNLEADDLEKLWHKADRSHLERVQRQFVKNSWLRKFGLAKRNKPKILGCHFSLFRKDIDRVNGFDERYEGWGLEDDDFCRRLYRAGIIGYSVIREARALHLWHFSAGSCARSLSESPNWNRFHAGKVPAYCVEGLSGS